MVPFSHLRIYCATFCFQVTLVFVRGTRPTRQKALALSARGLDNQQTKTFKLLILYFIELYFHVVYYLYCILLTCSEFVLYCIGADIYPGGGRAKPGFCLNLLDPGDTTPRRLGHYFTIFKQIRDTAPPQLEHYFFFKTVILSKM